MMLKSVWLGMLICGVAVLSFGASPVSMTVTEVLREPLPSEDLSCIESDAAIVVESPACRYTVDRASGAIAGLETKRDGLVQLQQAAELWFDDTPLSGCGGGKTDIAVQGKDKIVLNTRGALRDGVPYTLETTFYNDGVVVCALTLNPATDLSFTRGIRFEVSAAGQFSHYLHKRRDSEGVDSFQGALPEAGQTVELTTLTSCLEVFSSKAALAIFTDRGGTFRQPADAPLASLGVGEKLPGSRMPVLLTQHIVRVAPGGDPFVVRAGESFTFRTGLAVAPNRLPHPRWRDLRMFIWIGDDKHPYPADEEIRAAARLGFTLFQMHRLGTPGEPRPPAGEFDRVLKTVHDAGMLFIWTANADLMYANALGVQERIAAEQWPLWQGFNYGGRYKAAMDAYCDLIATCLASPNGLADYRMETIGRMLENYPVDGMYIDDNLPYANCTLWEEHGHPEPVYDCLIELHEVNWRRRQALLAKIPHAVLIDHSSHGFILPAISAFDCHLFGEGYSFPSVEAYWAQYGSYHNQPAQGCLWAGDTEAARCGTELAYAYDLLTGGGQYSYLDWRLWPDKFPYASGVNPDEVLFVEFFNAAQHYFGLYESDLYLFPDSRDWFAATAPGTYATLYHNRTWNDALVVVANPNGAPASTAVAFTERTLPPFEADRPLAVYDVLEHTIKAGRGREALAHLTDISLQPNQTRLFYVREAPENTAYHQWGGKRISEQWDPVNGTLSLVLHGPAGREDCVIIATGGQKTARVTVNGTPAAFFHDPARGLVWGNVVFGPAPISIVATRASEDTAQLPEQALPDNALSACYASREDPVP
ncbi:MAG TPA: hypothetical protein PLD73_02495 [Candidatus Hydrogenedentes bacterium]|jgi:hypothetical protein|nr:hypothetical protein [Candidatus Hydrogenedentota bacterium]HPJ98155.1 hypothetical protein [Candidatus Hydrogenedentota bacterium]